MLVAKRARIEKRVLLDHGVPVDCRSNLAHETLSRFLVTAGRLTEEAANEALGRSVAQEKLLGEMLVAEGKLEAADLQRLLQQNLARKLFDLFTWREGEVRFESGSVPSAAAHKVKVPRLVLTGVERFVPQEVVERAVSAMAGTLMVVDANSGAQRDELRPTARESALLDVLVRPRRLEELMTELSAPADELVRLIWGLALLGIVVPADRLGSGAFLQLQPPTPTPAVAVAAPPAPSIQTPRASVPAIAAATPSSPAAAAPAAAAPEISPEKARKIREDVRRAYATFRHRDPFDLLGAGEDSTAAEIRERYFALARDFAPWRFEAPELRQVAEEAKELFAAAAVAFAKLADPREREALRSERRRLRDAARREASASYFKIETDLLDATAQYKKGVALKEAKKLSQALQQFDFAADCDPQNGTYRAEAAYCRFLLAPTTMGVKSLAELVEAQRVDPESAPAYLYAGEIATRLGRAAEAERHYRKAAKLLGPDDRRALDALRESTKKKK